MLESFLKYVDGLIPQRELTIGESGAWNCIKKKIEEDQKASTNNGKGEICSENVCEYCTRPPQCHHCGDTRNHSYFVGRKLTPVL